MIPSEREKLLEEICDIFVHVHHKQHALRSPGGTFRTQLRALPFFASPPAESWERDKPGVPAADTAFAPVSPASEPGEAGNPN
jgi:hypothetical protein